MEKQQLVHKEKELTEAEIEEKAERVKQMIDKIREDPEVMKEIDQLIADNS